MIEKISAAILSYVILALLPSYLTFYLTSLLFIQCEVRQVPAIAFVSLQDTLFVTSTTLGAFEKVLRGAPFSLSPPPELSKTYIRATEHFNVSSDNGLYI